MGNHIDVEKLNAEVKQYYKDHPEELKSEVKKLVDNLGVTISDLDGYTDYDLPRKIELLIQELDDEIRQLRDLVEKEL